MGAFEKFCEHFIAQYPVLSDILTGTAIVMLFITSPILIFVIFKERYNKGRFIFQSKKVGENQREQLYLLDTMKGRLFFVDGKAFFNRVHERDWKEERAQKIGFFGYLKFKLRCCSSSLIQTPSQDDPSKPPNET